jgi:hypothetical protein
MTQTFQTRVQRASLCVLTVFLLTSCHDDDGGSVQQKTQKLSGTSISPPDSRPVAALLDVSFGNAVPSCSGTFLAEDVVLTAAHCFHLGARRDVKTQDIRVSHGESGIWVEATEVYIPPLYFGFDDSEHDWALIKLAAPVSGVPTAQLTGGLSSAPSSIRLESAQGPTKFVDGGDVDPTFADGTIDTGFDRPQFNFTVTPQAAQRGDSGGGIYDISGATPRVVGVMSAIKANTPQENWGTNMEFWRSWVAVVSEHLENDRPSSCVPRFNFVTVPSRSDLVRDRVQDVGCLEYRNGEYVGRFYDEDGGNVSALPLNLSSTDFPATEQLLMGDTVKSFVAEDFQLGTNDPEDAGFAIANGEKVVIVQPGRSNMEIDLDDFDPGSAAALRKVELYAFNLDFNSNGKELIVGVNRNYRIYQIYGLSQPVRHLTFPNAVPAYLNQDNAVDILLFDQQPGTLWLRSIRAGMPRNAAVGFAVGGEYDVDDAEAIGQVFQPVTNDDTAQLGGGGLALLYDGNTSLHRVNLDGTLHPFDQSGIWIWNQTYSDIEDPWTGDNLNRDAVSLHSVRDADGRIRDIEVKLDDGAVVVARNLEAHSGKPLAVTEEDIIGPLYGLPTGLTSDGKFLALNGEGLATVSASEVRLRLVYPDASPGEGFLVDLHDIDMGGLYDRGTLLDTCVQINSDPCGDRNLGGCLGEIVTTPPVLRLVTETYPEGAGTFFDAQWRTLEQNHACEAALDQEACEASGSYRGTFTYEVRAFLVESGGDCSVAPAPGDNVAAQAINGFKIRADGFLSHPVGELSFEGYDDFGPWAAPERPYLTDTDYDGVFSFAVSGAWAATNMTLTDMDSDDLDEDNDGDPNDFPSDAVGMNSEIEYVLELDGVPLSLPGPDWDDTNLVSVASNLSGNCDTSTGMCSAETREFSVPGTDGVFHWKFRNVGSMNNVHITSPHGSPHSFEMMSSSLPRPRPTQAVRVDEWADAPTSIPGMLEAALPIVLGSKTGGQLDGESLELTTTASALTILNGTASALRDALIRELLAVELNLSLTADSGETLASSTIYGTTRSVGAVVRDAHAAIRGPSVFADNAELSRLLTLLQAVNYGDVTYLQPGFSTPGAPGGDSDGDGTVNLKDNCPETSNTDQADDDGDGIGNACRVNPFVHCVRRKSSGYMAYFGYESPLQSRTLAVGARNFFTTSQPDRGQPVEFVSGVVERAFSVPFATGSSVTWTLEGQSVTASQTSPACSARDLFEVSGFEDVAVYGRERLMIQNSVSVLGALGPANLLSGGQVEVAAEASAGTTRTRGKLFLRSNSTLFGDAISGDLISLQAGAQVQGESVMGAYVEPHDIDWAPVFPSPVGGHVNLEPERIRALAPGAYGNVSIKSRAVLTLVAGTYTMNSFAVEPQARIVFDDSAGPIYIHVRDMLTYRGDSTVSTSHSADVLLGYFGTATAYFDAPFYGDILAPRAEIVLGSQDAHEGRFFARKVEVRSGSGILYRKPDAPLF